MTFIISMLFGHFLTDSTHQDSILLTTVKLQQVNITANKIQTHDLETLYSINKLSTEQLKNNLSRTTPEALQACVGVFVQKTNHGGGSPILRGLMGNQTLLMLDGVRLNNSTFRYGPNQYLNTVDPYSLDKIEILSGSGSVQYGSDALGGIIHLFSADPTLNTGFSANILGRITSHNMEQTGRAEINYGAKKFAASAAVTIRNFGDLYGGSNIGRQSPSGYGENTNFLKLKYVHKNNTFIISNQYYNASDVPITHKIKLENFSINEISRQNRNLSYLKHTWTTKSKWLTELNTTLSRHHTQEHRESQKANSNLSLFEKDQVNTIGITTSITSVLSAHWQANTGIELYTDKVFSKKELTNIETMATQPGRGLYPDRSRFGSYSVYSIHQFKFDPIYISGGLRYNNFKININETGIGNIRITPSALVYNLNMGYKLNKYTMAYAAVNSGYRAPNIDDMGTLGIVDFRYEVPAFDLKPERSRTSELGLKILKQKYQITTAIYNTSVSNLIARVKVPEQIISGYPVYKKENIGKAIIRGFENTINFALLKNIQVNSQLTYTYGKNKLTNEPLRRIPPLFGIFSVRYVQERFFIKSEWAFASKQSRLANADKEDNRIGLNGTAAWNVLNIYTGIQLKKIDLQLGLQNAGNAAYKIHGSGVYGQGRSLTLQLQYYIQKNH